MAQKRVLLIGTMLLSAAIGAPTLAMLAPGGEPSEPAPSAVEPAEADPVPPAPVDEEALPFPIGTLTTTAPRPRNAPANSGGEVPSHLGETAVPQRTTAPPRRSVRPIQPAQPGNEGEPQAPAPEPVEEETVVPPPTLPSDPDDADSGDPTPPGPVRDDDPADEGDDPADR